MLRALTEGREISAIRSFENLIDACIVFSGHQSGKESVTGGKSVLHTFGHAFILCGHQPAGLGARCAKGILYLSWREMKEFGNGCCCGWRSKDGSLVSDRLAMDSQTIVSGRNTYAMPPAAQHLRTVESTADSGAELEAYDSGSEKSCTIDLRNGI